MASLFSSTKNTRRLIENSNRFIRSDVPAALDQNEIQWLKDQNVFTVIDLRERSEQALKPCILKDDPCFDYFTMPVTGGNMIPSDPEDVTASYIKMCDENKDASSYYNYLNVLVKTGKEKEALEKILKL